MLVLNRKQEEKIMIGNQLAVHVISIGRENVRLGFDAPGHIKILRHELFEAATLNNPDDVKPQIPSKQVLDSLSDLEVWATAHETTLEQVLETIVRRFLEEQRMAAGA